MNISPLAVVHPEAQIGQNVTIDPFAVIEKDVVIGDNCHIYSRFNPRTHTGCDGYMRS